MKRPLNNNTCPWVVVLGSSFIFVWTDGFFMRQLFLGQTSQAAQSLLAFSFVFLISCIPLASVTLHSKKLVSLGILPLPRKAIIAIGLFTTLCSLCFTLSEYPALSWLFIPATISGLGYAALLLEWGRIYGRQRGQSTYLTLPAVFATSIALDIPLLLMPPILGAITFSCTPFLSSLFLAYVRSNETAFWKPGKDLRVGPESDTEIILSSSKARKILGVPAVFLTGVALFNIAFGYMQYTTSFSEVSNATDSVLVTVVRGTTALALLLGMGLAEIKPHRIIKVGLMVSIAGFIAVPLISHPDTHLTTLMACIVIAGDTACDMFIWILGSEYARFDAQGEPDYAPFALIHFAVAISLVCGLGIGSLLFAPWFFSYMYPSATTAICYLLVTSVALFLAGDSNIWTLFEIELSHSENIAPEPVDQFRHLASASNFEDFCCSHRLSSRQRDVLKLILEGRNVKRMAEELEISEHTVVTHVRNLYKRLDCHSRQEIIDLVHKHQDFSTN